MTTDALFGIDNLTWEPPGGGPRLFDGVDFDVEPGTCLGLEGPSGSGKSTLLRCLVGLEPRVSGEIKWRGETVAGEEIRKFRRRVVYVHQEPVNVAETIEENLAFAREMANAIEIPELGQPLDRDAQRERMAGVGLGDIDWERNFDELSVGERQRVAFVRCLTLQPAALLLDEPTASLDAESRDHIEALMEDYLAEAPDQRALVWVSHDASQIERVATDIVDIRSLGTTT